MRRLLTSPPGSAISVSEVNQDKSVFAVRDLADKVDKLSPEIRQGDTIFFGLTEIHAKSELRASFQMRKLIQ